MGNADPGTETGPVPVTLLTGFLGAGKTTLVNRILTERSEEPICVIVNEFGELGIDGRLVVSSAEEVVELANGCVCCSIRGDLKRTLERLLARRRQPGGWFARILIESSGVAAPGPIVQTLLVDPLLRAETRLDGVVTLAHAEHLCGELEGRPECREQVAYADVVLLNHADRVEAEDLARAERAVRARNALCRLEVCERCDVDAGALLSLGTGEAERWDLARHERILPPEGTKPGHTDDVSTVALVHRGELDLHRVKIWLQFLANRRGQDIFRVKGILRCRESATAVVVQGMYEWLELGPGDGPPPAESALVAIGRDLDHEEWRRGWRACLL